MDQVFSFVLFALVYFGLEFGGRCTGIEPMYRLRASLNLNRQTAVIGTVGSEFLYDEGIHPTAIAQ